MRDLINIITEAETDSVPTKLTESKMGLFPEFEKELEAKKQITTESRKTTKKARANQSS